MEKIRNLPPGSALESGVILLTTLVMISVLASLLLVLMQTLLLYAKASSQFMVRQNAFYQLESAMHLLLADKRTWEDVRCQSARMDENEVLAWLTQHAGCVVSFGGESYTYVVTPQGEFPCLKLQFGSTQVSSAHGVLTVRNQAGAVLQVRMARPGGTGICRLPVINQIKPGMLSWRYLGAL